VGVSLGKMDHVSGLKARQFAAPVMIVLGNDLDTTIFGQELSREPLVGQDNSVETAR